MVEFLRTGIVTEPHGIRGEVKVYPTTDDPKRFEVYGELVVERGGKTPEESGGGEVRKIERVRYGKGRVILKLSGIDDRNAAELLRRAELYVHRQNTPPPEDGKFLTADLYGLLAVTEEGEPAGTVEDVLKTGANDVLVLRTKAGKEILLPCIPLCVKQVDVSKGTVTVYVLPGLEDL